MKDFWKELTIYEWKITDPYYHDKLVDYDEEDPEVDGWLEDD